MLKITADVNGHLIGYIFIHNTGRTHKGNVWEYDAATWDPSRLDGTLGIEKVRHQRDEPWHKLVAMAMKQGGL